MYTLPDLPYDYGALEPAMSGEILELHHDKHHATYVKGANDTIEKIAEARDKGDLSGIVGLEKTLAFNVSGHVLHSIFWENLSPDGGDKPDGALGTAIDEHFGSFDKFRAQLTAATQTTQGSGWGVLAWEPIGKRLLVTQVYDHHGNVAAGMTPRVLLRPGKANPFGAGVEVALGDLAVRRHPRAGLEAHEVARHQLGHRQLDLGPAAQALPQLTLSAAVAAPRFAPRRRAAALGGSGERADRHLPGHGAGRLEPAGAHPGPGL